MNGIYEMDVIPIILKRFDVNEVIISGSSNNVIPSKVINYCNVNKFSYKFIDTKKSSEKNFVMANTLDILHKLKDYGAIFINDDPNWYTVFNELNIITEKNDEFPLVFICHNIFPHKNQDSYINPNIIPPIFRNEYDKKLFLDDETIIVDAFYHAIHKNTSKNGVSEAINDFLVENQNVSVMDIGLVEGIMILYDSNNVGENILQELYCEIDDYKLDYEYLFNTSLKNQVLINNFSKYSDRDALNNILIEVKDKENLIKDYEIKLQNQKDEIYYKNIQIENMDSQLQLNDSQIMYIESKLINKEIEVHDLNKQLQMANKKISKLNDTFNKKEDEFNKQLTWNISQLNDRDVTIFNQYYKIDMLYHKLEKNERLKDSYKRNYFNLLSKFTFNEYVQNSLNEEILEKQLEINYINQNYLIKKVMIPFSYLLLLIKSKKEFPLNYKLFNALRRTNLFDIGYYLRNNEDIQNCNWVNYFPLELHYVCNGFREKRRFTRRYYNTNSKKELLNFILNNKQI